MATQIYNKKRFILALAVFACCIYFLDREDVLQRFDQATEPIPLNERLHPKNVSILNDSPHQVLENKIISKTTPEKKTNSVVVNPGKPDKNSSSVSWKKKKKNVVTKNATSILNTLRLSVLEDIFGRNYDPKLEVNFKDGGSLPLEEQNLPKKKQIIVATTWRSGSTFLNDLLGSHPGTYNFYEPLLPYGILQIYDEKSLNMSDGTNVQDLIQDLLKCSYNNKYIKKINGKKILVGRNTKLRDLCKGKASSLIPLCYQKTFLEPACSLFPWIIMKVVRLGLKFLKPVLEDESLNPYVIHLVRDPRPVIHSRISTVKWCRGECRDALSLCNHMEDNLKFYKEFSTLYPGRIHLLRYEDISLSPMNVSKELLENIDFDFNPKLKSFIDYHTKTDFDMSYSTKRESSKHVLKWTSQIDSGTLDTVQKACAKVMDQMGYLQITSTTNITINDVLGPLNL